MALKRFASNSDFAPDALIIIENFGLAVYMAQLFERDLQIVIAGIERLGQITVPHDTIRSRDGLVEACLGPMIRWAIDAAKLDVETSRMLKKANYQRNLLAHGFLAENVVDMLNDAGRASVNEKLHRIFTNICQAHGVVVMLRDVVWSLLGVSRAEIGKQVEEEMGRFADRQPGDEDSDEHST